MTSLLETGNIEEAAKTLQELKPPKRYVWKLRLCPISLSKTTGLIRVQSISDL